MLLWIICLLALGLAGFVAAVLGIDSYHYRRTQKITQTFRSEGGSKILVVFFSRSGNTELMARRQDDAADGC